MSIENTDPRSVLVRNKYFSLRPKPLEKWLWQQGLPAAAERVFWLHWEEGMRRGDWCSELSLKQVARECCVDVSTVTRSYQLLRRHELIRREDPGRDPQNPFQQAIAITEVRVPRDLLRELGRSPDRPKREAAAEPARRVPPTVSREAVTGAAPPRAEAAALMRRLSDAERAAFFVASRDRRPCMAFDTQSGLSSVEQAQVQHLLARLCSDSGGPTVPTSTAASNAQAYAAPRRLSPLEAARLRKALSALVPAGDASRIFREVLWSMEQGALRRFDSRLAGNIALKKIREGAWSRPHRMPPNWLGLARPETCDAA